jgi:AcrR family transcriptional regulator
MASSNVSGRRAVKRRGSSTAGRPTKEAAAAIAEHVLSVARELFLEQGFARTSLNQIAADAAVTKRTIYVKLGGKNELLRLVVAQVLQTARTQLDDPGPNTSIAARLGRFARSMLSIALAPDVLRLHRLMVAEALRFPQLARLMDEQLAHGARASLEELLRDEMRRGRLTLTDPDMKAQLLSAMILGEPQRASLMGPAPWSEEQCSNYVDAAVRLFLASQITTAR